MRRERASDRSRSECDRLVDGIHHSSDPGCHTWRRAHLDGSDESRGPQDRQRRRSVNFTDALGFFIQAA